MWCTECNKECEHYTEDVGIGHGEAHGVKFNDVREIQLSQCCDGEVTDTPPINWCPICEDVDLDAAAPMVAMSRKDPKVTICSDCGTREALEDIRGVL